MSPNICLVSMVKAERDQVCDCSVSKSKLHYTVLLKREGVCYLKHNRRLASGDYFKFHKFKMKFKQYGLKENMGPSGILKLHFPKIKWSSHFIKKSSVDGR